MTPFTSTVVATSSASTSEEEFMDITFHESHQVSMMFYPKAWKSAPDMSCDWVCSDFPPVPKTNIPKKSGVYVFVVMTELFGFPHANGLFYIGKATNLYERIGSYISEANGKFVRSKRPQIWRMLYQWRGHLKYIYTTTDDVSDAEILENHMLNAFQPPFNRRYEASTSQTIRAFI